MNKIIRDAVIKQIHDCMDNISPEIAEAAIETFNRHVARATTAMRRRYSDKIPPELANLPMLQDEWQKDVRNVINGGQTDDPIAYNQADIRVDEATAEWARRHGLDKRE